MPHRSGQSAPQRQKSGNDRQGNLSDGRWRVEILLFAGMLAIYQLSRTLVVGDASEAIKNAFSVINLEKATGFFFEPRVQSALIDNLHITKGMNLFYIWAHLPITAAFFIWLYRRRRPAYTFVRNAFFLANLFALAVFVVFPVAPPRMMHNEGFVDTLSLFSGINLHGGHLSGLFNPFAAVPSMHMGYALMVGVIVAYLTKHWYVRAIALLYPMLVFITILATANHYVFDALAGGAVTCAAFAVMALITRHTSTLRAARASS